VPCTHPSNERTNGQSPTLLLPASKQALVAVGWYVTPFSPFWAGGELMKRLLEPSGCGLLPMCSTVLMMATIVSFYLGLMRICAVDDDELMTED
jgi:hypothetical protein